VNGSRTTAVYDCGAVMQ